MKPFFSSTERGQALILITLAAIGLFAVAGLAIDGSAKYSDRRHAQNAADTAALAGSLSLVNGNTTIVYGNVQQWQYTALQRADSNGYDRDLVTNRIWVYKCTDSKTDPTSLRYGSPVDCGPYEGKADYVQVAITSHINTYFARVIGINQVHNTVSALAMSQKSYTGQLYGGASIVGLAPDQCKTVWLSGSADTTVIGGGIFSNSKLDCGVTIAGSTDILMDGSISMAAAGYTKNGNPPLGGISGGLHGGASQYDYPPAANSLPKITCSGTATKSGSTMSPGNYSGTFPPNGVKTLSAGTYCVNGDFKLTGSDQLTGTGVTIYMQSGGIDWKGGAKVNLSAPTSGSLAGLLIYAPMSNSSSMSFNGNASSSLTGTIYMPAAPLVYNGTGNLNPSHVQIIAYTVEITGSNTTSIIYQNPDNWDETIPAQVGIMQ